MTSSSNRRERPPPLNSGRDSNGNGQISWPPMGSSTGHQWAVSWPPMGSFPWPLTSAAHVVTMINFNELHPRSRSGTFTRQSHSFPDITLDAVLISNPDPLPVFDTLGGVHREILAYAGGARIRRIVPHSSSDVHDSLSFDCSPTSGIARLIVIRDPLATVDQEIARIANIHAWEL